MTDEAAADADYGLEQHGRENIHQQHLQPGHGVHLSDATAHNSAADHVGALNAHCHQAGLSDTLENDGDTLWLDIDCGFRVWTRQKVRLRGMDTPELGTAEGRRAKDFVTTALRDVSSVAVTTAKPDKHDRYLADVFFLSGAETTEVVFQEGTFLNRALLEAGLAKRYSE